MARIYSLTCLVFLCMSLTSCAVLGFSSELDGLDGIWNLSQSSGGFTGEGIPGIAESRQQIVFTADHVAEYYQDGGLVRTRQFTLTMGDTIFGRKHLIEFDDGESLVVELLDEDTLSLSENEYDGFILTYLRAK
jgi:hypothetical protein